MDEPSFLLEKMTVNDLPEVLAIENVSFPTPFTENLYRMELALSVASLYVVRESREGAILGYMDFWKVADELHLITIAVHPEFRKRHVGGFLIEKMIEEARKEGVARISLDVRPSNQSAIGLYRRFGFEQVGVRKRYYQDNQEDALTLVKTL